MLRRAACLLLTFLLMCAVAARAQRTTNDGLRQPRILLLLDGSSSMLQPWNNTIRFKAAGRLISRLMDSIYTVNAGVEFGLRVYGHQSPAQINDCFDSRMEVMFSKNNAVQMGLRLASLRPFGVSPIAYSLKEAAENDLADEVRNAYSVILITDGGESCGGNICDVVKTLIERKISFKPYILSLINYAPLKEQYACLGTYLQVSNDAEMGPAINRIVEDYRPMLTMPIMIARTEPAAPKPAMVAVYIPAWVPDRSPVATLSVTIPRTTTLPVYYSSRPAPRRVIVTRPTPIPKPEPEPVIVPAVRTAEVAPASIKNNTRPVMIRVAYSKPVPRRRTLPSQTPFPKPEPAVRTAEADIASISSNTRPTTMRIAYSKPVPRRRTLPTQAPFPKPEPAVRTAEAAMASISSNTRPTTMRIVHANPVPRRMALPTQAPFPKPEPAVRTAEADMASISSNTRPTTMRIVHANPVPRRMALPTQAPFPKPEPAVRTAEAAMASISSNTLPVTMRVAHSNPAPRRRTLPTLAPFPKPEPAVRTAEANMAGISSNTRPTTMRIAHSNPAPRRMPLPAQPAFPKPLPEPVVKRDTVAAIKPTPATAPRVDTAKSTVVIKRIDIPVTTAPKPKPAAKTTPDNNPKETTFTSEREDAKETSLSILFTDGRGKFYASTPQLQLMDAVSGKLVKQFYRTVDAAGNPDPQTVPAGTYNLLVAGRANMLMRRIVVEKDKSNKIIVKVAHGSLRFRYEDAPDRPVTEFDAIVNIRFEPGPTVKQRCTAELEYAPGNYYIEINTMPVSRFNTDIDFGAITEIQIPQPGYVQFTNKAPLGTVSLFTPLGNKFVRFYGLRITGDPENQRLRLRPGLYEVRWVKNPSAPFAAETVERFLVKSNSVTEVELQ